MNSSQLIFLNYEEIRRRSIILWNGIPEQFYNWRPDHDAMSIIELVRHVLESEYIYQKIIIGRGDKGDLSTPWENLPYTTIADELTFAAPYRENYFKMIKSFSEKDLEEIEIVRPALGQRRKLGDYLLRIAYHEAIHAGNVMSYLRTLGIERPNIWD
ncbi:MAG: DinB family protein [Bacteroidota bacterium]